MGAINNQAEEVLKAGYRKTAKWYLRGCQALLSVAILMPIISVFDIRPSFETVEIWFQRSGSITTIYALLSTTVADMGLRRLHRPGENGDIYKLQVLGEFSGSFEKVRLAALVLTVIGTVIWGYGDTVYKWSIQELTLEKLKVFVSTVVWVCSVLSAVSWAKSSAAKVAAKIPGSHLVWTDEDGSETDLVATAKLQGKWNKIAAIFASIAAIAQAISVLLS